jgi:Caspase domain/WD domain, G-beta repeat/Bacterial Ig domain
MGGRDRQEVRAAMGPLRARDLIRSVRFSPDGKALAASSNGGVQLWEVKTGKELSTWAGRTNPASMLAFARDGRWLASGVDDRVKVWDVSSGRELRSLSGSTAWISSVDFSPDGRHLAAGGTEGSVRIWDTATGVEVALITAAADGGDWVAITPDGLFDGSSQGANMLVAWRIANRVYPADRFFADYFSPGLLAEIFAGRRPKPATDLAALKLPPEVRITSPSTGMALERERASLVVEVADRGGGVAFVRLYQNGKLVEERPGKPGAQSSYEFIVDLIAGENLLKASALTSDRVESNEDHVRLVVKSPAAARPALHLLAVGINQYQDPAFDLGFARPDAAAIARFFEEKGRGLFASVSVVKLFDKDATRVNIVAALNQLADQARPEDVVLIYMAGHGVGVGQQFYFLPHEMRRELDEDAAIRKYGIAASLFGEFLGHARTKALKQVLVLDTCYSGAALNVLGKVPLSRGKADEQKALRMLARAEGIFLIAAATSQQMAYEVPELGHGVLAYALLTGLGDKGPAKAPIKMEGFVSVLSLLTYASDTVPQLAERYYGRVQQLNLSAQGMDFPLALR